jgi:hypothetical protein
MSGQDNGLPFSIPALAAAAYRELSRIDQLRATAFLRQGAQGHADDHPYAAPTDESEIMTYRDYAFYLTEYEARLLELIPPAALRLVRKYQQEEVPA